MEGIGFQNGQIPKGIRMMEWIVRNCRKSDSLAVRGPATLLFPDAFFETFYSMPEFGAGSMKRPLFSLSFDCDFRADNEALPQLIEVLSSYEVKCDFAAIGKWVEEYPRAYSKVLDSGHDLINHTYTHPNNEELSPGRYFKDLSTQEKREEIVKCHEAVRKELGYEMKGYRTPHFGVQWTHDVYGILEGIGYKFSSSVIASKAEKFVPYWVGQIIEFPVSICPKHPFSTFDSYHVVRAGKHTAEEFLGIFRLMMEKCKKESLFVNLYFDPQDVASLREFGHMLEALHESKVEMLRLGQVAGRLGEFLG